MNPDLEFFLESAFDPIQPTSDSIGRVVIDPDYNVMPEEQDRGRLATELLECLRQYSGAKEFSPPKQYSTLAKYVREISLHDDRLDGPWVEVTPPGNWI